MTSPRRAIVLPLLVAFACLPPEPMAPVDAGPGAAPPGVDAGTSQATDSGTDAGADGSDGGSDAGADGGSDGGADAGGPPWAPGCVEVDLSSRVALRATNRWVPLSPSFELPDGGVFGNRAWTKLLYDSTRRVFLLYEGYVGPRHPYTIYSNALFTFDPVTGVLALDKASHWFNGPGPGYDTLARPENATDPTPGDRHQTQTFTFVPEEHAAYLFSGLNQALQRPQGVGHPIDLWRYDVRARRWTELTPPRMPVTHSGDQAMVTATWARRLVMFAAHDSDLYRADQTWVFGLDAGTWTSSKPSPSPPARVGAGLLADPVRRRVLLMGGGWGLGDAPADLWSYDVAANRWAALAPGPFAARAGQGVGWDCRRDRFLIAAGRASISEGPLRGDTWVVHPDTLQGRRLDETADAGPVGTIWGDLAYSPDHDVFFAIDGSEGATRFWLLRLEP